jgi:hypothetical protein
LFFYFVIVINQIYYFFHLYLCYFDHVDYAHFCLRFLPWSSCLTNNTMHLRWLLQTSLNSNDVHTYAANESCNSSIDISLKYFDFLIAATT